MSAYFPPEYYFNNIQFNSSYYTQEDTTGLTISEADGRYLRFPSAQGTENLQDINVNGISTFNNTLTTNSIISFKDNLSPFTNNTTAYKSGNNLVLQGQDNSSGLAVINKDNAGNNVTSFTSTATDTIFNTEVRSSSFIQRNGALSVGTINNNTFNLIQTNLPRISISSSAITASLDLLAGKPITTNSTTGGDRSVKTSYLQLTDIGSTTILNNDFQMYHSGVQTYLTNTDNGGVFGFYVRDSVGNTRNTIFNTYDDLTITSTNAPTTNFTTPVPTNDATNKIATTGWVQGVVSPSTYQLNYPQKWYSSSSNNSSANANNIQQSVDVVFDIPNSSTTNTINGVFVELSIRYTINGYVTGTTAGNYGCIYSGRFDGMVFINIKDRTNSSGSGTNTGNNVALIATTNNANAYTQSVSTSGTPGSVTTIPISGDYHSRISSPSIAGLRINNVQGANVSGTWNAPYITNPILLQYNPNLSSERNILRVIFNPITFLSTGVENGVFNIIRSVEIMNSTINTTSTTTSLFYPSTNTTQLPAYLR
jgi:hypothetical protein